MTRDIVSIRQDLTDAQNNLANLRGQLSTAESALRDWQNAGNSDLQNKLRRIAECTAEVARIKALVQAATAQVDSLTTELDKAIKAKELLDAGLAKAAAEGLTGPEALERAKALASREKLKNTALTIGIAVLALALGLWLWRKYRKA